MLWGADILGVLALLLRHNFLVASSLNDVVFPD